MGSCLIGNIHAYLTEIGALSFWHPLNSSTIHAVEILGGDRSGLWVKTNDEKIMTTYGDCLSGSNCPQWYETDHVPNDLDKGLQSFERSRACEFTKKTPKVFYPPPGKVRECALVIDALFPHVVNTNIYALLEDGSVWYWTISWNSMPGMAGVNALYLVASIFCPMFGFIFALAIFFAQVVFTEISKRSTTPQI
jgi:hypothetical protein